VTDERPLSHLRVLDLTRLLPGGYCTLLLADLGADVIKVEQPGGGDYIRWMPPERDEVSAGHLALNRGKRSITLNLKHAEGPGVLKRLDREADVLVESFRPGVMERLGVGFETLTEENERLVYCAITGYGQDGPYRDRAGHDQNYLGYAGVLDVIGELDGPPVVPGVQIADVGGGGLMASTGILAALAERERTGRGRFVDISMMDGAFSWLSIHGAAYALTGEIPRRGAMRLSGAYACYHPYEAADGRWITVGALEPQFFIALCEVLGVPEFAERQFVEGDEQCAMIERLKEIFRTRTRDEWMAELEHLEACVGPVKTVAEAYQDPQLRARGMIVETPLPSGLVATIGNPVRFAGEPPARGAPPPGFGEHTDQVLAAGGYDAGAIARMRAAGIL